jgi:hypothetical protein
VFVTPGADVIDTQSKVGLQYMATFNLDADLIGSTPLSTGGWTMSEVTGSEGVGTSMDYDTMRLYNTEPTAFPAPNRDR